MYWWVYKGTRQIKFKKKQGAQGLGFSKPTLKKHSECNLYVKTFLTSALQCTYIINATVLKC